MRAAIQAGLFIAVLGSLRGDWVTGELNPLGTLAGGATAWQRSVTNGDQSVRLSGVTFQAGRCGLRVADNPPAHPISLEEAVISAGAVAGSNAGYFHPDFRPLGLVVSGGKLLHAQEKAALLSGILMVRGNRMEIIRSGRHGAVKDLREALQAGPWLVEHGKPTGGLNAEKRARRSVVMNDGAGRWALIATSSISLRDLAGVLSLPGIAGSWKAANALNLDGGSSTALLAIKGRSPVLEIRSFGPVRNYLLVVPREP